MSEINPALSVLTDEQQARIAAAREAAKLLRSDAPLSPGAVDPYSVMALGDWLLTGSRWGTDNPEVELTIPDWVNSVADACAHPDAEDEIEIDPERVALLIADDLQDAVTAGLTDGKRLSACVASDALHDGACRHLVTIDPAEFPPAGIESGGDNRYRLDAAGGAGRWGGRIR